MTFLLPAPLPGLVLLKLSAAQYPALRALRDPVYLPELFRKSVPPLDGEVWSFAERGGLRS